MNYCIKCMEFMQNDSNTCNHCGAKQNKKAPAHHLPIGTILNNRYYVGCFLGENDFEITYIGKDVLLDQTIVIKEYFPNKLVKRNSHKSLDVINAECTGSYNYELSRDTFIQEANALQKLNGLESLIDILDIFAEHNTAYYVRDYVLGTTIERYVEENGIIDEHKLVEQILPIIKSLGIINNAGIFHCNISPDSIMLLENGSAKLFDFGLAIHSLVVSDNSLLIENPSGYIAIETYARRPNLVDATDVFSVCATLYKGITGIAPPDTLERHIKDDIKSPYALGMSIAPHIEYAIMKGLSLQQEGRYQNMAQLFSALGGEDAEKDSSSSDKSTEQDESIEANNQDTIDKPTPNVRVRFTFE